jgi:hypothetical protein
MAFGADEFAPDFNSFYSANWAHIKYSRRGEKRLNTGAPGRAK